VCSEWCGMQKSAGYEQKGKMAQEYVCRPMNEPERATGKRKSARCEEEGTTVGTRESGPNQRPAVNVALGGSVCVRSAFQRLLLNSFTSTAWRARRNGGSRCEAVSELNRGRRR